MSSDIGKLTESTDSIAFMDNTLRDTSPLCVKFCTQLAGTRRRGSESDDSNFHILPGLTYLLDPQGKVGILSETATTGEADTVKARIGEVANRNSADELNGIEDNNKCKSDVGFEQQLRSMRNAPEGKVGGISHYIELAGMSNSAASSSIESVVKLRWKKAARAIHEKQKIRSKKNGDKQEVLEEGFTDFDTDEAAAKHDEDCIGPREDAWSKLLKKLHDEKIVMLEKSNFFGESIRDHSKEIRAKGKIASEALRDKSKTASLIVKQRSASASKAVRDLSKSATRPVRSVSSSFKSPRSRSPSLEDEAHESNSTLNKEGRRFFKCSLVSNRDGWSKTWCQN